MGFARRAVAVAIGDSAIRRLLFRQRAQREFSRFGKRTAPDDGTDVFFLAREIAIPRVVDAGGQSSLIDEMLERLTLILNEANACPIAYRARLVGVVECPFCQPARLPLGAGVEDRLKNCRPLGDCLVRIAARIGMNAPPVDKPVSAVLAQERDGIRDARRHLAIEGF